MCNPPKTELKKLFYCGCYYCHLFCVPFHVLKLNQIQLDEKQEQHGDPPQLAPTKIYNGEEEQLHSNFKQNHHPSKIEEQHDSKPIDDDVLQNDIQWGRKTLQKLLTNLGLL